MEDLAVALRIIAGPDGQEWEVPPVSLGSAPAPALDTLRLAWSADFGGVQIAHETRTALAALGDRLTALGCRVEESLPDGFDFVEAWETYGALRQAEAGSAQPAGQEAELATRYGARADAESPMLRGMASAVGATMRLYTTLMARRDALIAALERFFTEWDALLCPVSVGPAFPHCSPGTPILVDGTPIPYGVGGWAYCTPFNLTGHPAVVLPLTRSADELPIGLQVVGRRWHDMRLLGIAERLSEVVGPFRRPPTDSGTQ